VDVETAEQTDAGLQLHVCVRDTGIGIPQEKRNDIFKAFTQADMSTTRRFGGTGLGLTISMSLVELMGGRMWVDSEVDQGSTFHFTAWFDRDTARDEEHLVPEISVDLRGLSVLVVDDNATNRRILEEMLGNWKMRVEAVDERMGRSLACSSTFPKTIRYVS